MNLRLHTGIILCMMCAFVSGATRPQTLTINERTFRMRATLRIPELSDKSKRLFWSKVIRGEAGQCWKWRGCVCAWGYGKVGIGRKTYSAVRISWALANGDAGPLYVLHKCDNPECCNPDHLFLGTISDNSKDMVAKGRAIFNKGHTIGRGTRNHKAKLTEAQVRLIRKLYAKRNTTLTKLGARFGVNHSSIGEIVRRTHWKHIV